jgi:hypothetical protein
MTENSAGCAADRRGDTFAPAANLMLALDGCHVSELVRSDKAWRPLR